jgi:hypothetical protein
LFFLLFLLDDRKIRIREAQKHLGSTDPSGSGSATLLPTSSSLTGLYCTCLCPYSCLFPLTNLPTVICLIFQDSQISLHFPIKNSRHFLLNFPPFSKKHEFPAILRYSRGITQNYHEFPANFRDKKKFSHFSRNEFPAVSKNLDPAIF